MRFLAAFSVVMVAGCALPPPAPPPSALRFRGHIVGSDDNEPGSECRLALSAREAGIVWSDASAAEAAIRASHGVGSQVVKVSDDEGYLFALADPPGPGDDNGAMIAERSRRILGRACQARARELARETYREVTATNTIEMRGGVRVKGAPALKAFLADLARCPAKWFEFGPRVEIVRVYLVRPSGKMAMFSFAYRPGALSTADGGAPRLQAFLRAAREEAERVDRIRRARMAREGARFDNPRFSVPGRDVSRLMLEVGSGGA